jgi:hypothetical protein
MKIDFDPAKSDKNRRERNLPFSMVEFFDFETAFHMPDTRKDYGEIRTIAYGLIGKRLHVLCFKPLPGGHIRVISLRKANKREEKKYEQEKKALD